MPEQALKDKTAIVGIGWTAFTAKSGTTVANLAAEASLNAIADAGLAKRDVDGVVTYCFQTDTFDARQLAATLGLERCAFIVNERLGGGWACSAVATAAMAVHAGLCQNVLVFRAMNGRSERPTLDPMRTQAVGPRQWTAPFGVYHAADTFGPYVTAHMARYGTTNLDLGHIAVTQRANAALNQKAMLRKPLTLEEHQQSPWVSYPFRLLDTCLTSDGAVAVIVTSTERAHDLRQVPVSIMAAMGGTLPAVESLPIIARFARASMDISDGLLADARKLASASNVNLRIRANDVPLAIPVMRWVQTGGDFGALVTGGDDYVVLFTAEADQREAIAAAEGGDALRLTRIGSVHAGEGVELVDRAGKTIVIPESGYVHRLGR